MQIKEFLKKIEEDGIQVWEAEGKLKYRAPAGKMRPDYIRFMKDNKENLLRYLQEQAQEMILEHHPEQRYEPFPLTEIQMSYLLGRERYFQYGDTACHIYFEMEYEKLDSKRIELVWNEMVKEHDMLHAIIHKEGFQEVMEQIPSLQIPVYDGEENVIAKIRKELGHIIYDTEQWPAFGVVTVQYPEKTVICYSFDFLLSDWSGIWSLLYEFEQNYQYAELKPQKPKVTFRDYVVFYQKLKQTKKYKTAREYWLNRLEQFPEAPKLPVLRKGAKGNVHFTRYRKLLDKNEWNQLQVIGKDYGVTGTVIVLTLYALVLAKWSSNKHFCMNLTLLNRMPVHQDIQKVIGDFTSITLLEMDYRRTKTYLEQMQEVAEQLFQDIDNQLFSGVEVLRELSGRHNGEVFMMPFVFTSAIGSNSSQIKGKMGYGISQTPQVFIDCQVMDTSDGLLINWDIRDGVFEESMIVDMFALFCSQLEALAGDREKWKKEAVADIPDWQKKERKAVNGTETFVNRFLEDDIWEQSKKQPDKLAVVDASDQFTYRELATFAKQIGKQLMEDGIVQGDCVGILMEKSVWQVAAVLGILKAGAVYVPIDVKQGEKRIYAILSQAGIKMVLTAGEKTVDGVSCKNVKQFCQRADNREIEDWETLGSPDRLAYVIFTSGSTGTPKGVAISHKAAMNTIDDINKRYQITSKDTVLGLSQLNFDLSVYDIFGVLGQGGTLVFPDNNRYYDPSHWREQMERYHVTIWNTVPALMQMLTETFSTEAPCQDLRVAMLSGDWIPVELAAKLKQRIPGIRIACMGGATEASIWSILHEYEEEDQERESIPYGTPLANQTFYVLDEKMEDCPIGVTGELYIGGAGLAKEYYNNEQLTKNSFLYDEKTKERLYKTGDLGKYLPGGEIAFAGRKDTQVKIKGHRIELGEIESAMKHLSYVKQAVVLVHDENGDHKLIGYAECEGKAGEEQILEDCKEYLPAYMIPQKILCYDKMPLTGNGKIDRKQLAKDSKQVAGLEKTEKQAALDGIDEEVLQVVEGVLGTALSDVTKSFYFYGADSFLMAQLVGKLRDRFALQQEFGTILLQLMNHPTLIETANYVKQNKRERNTDRRIT